jgi:DEAD/DEAH box helicase
MPSVPEHAGARWMRARGWQPFAFQHEVWQAISDGRSGLLHATTGSGKTYAIWLGILGALPARDAARTAAPLSALWITPMRALAADTLRALREPLADLQPGWTLGLRTGDTAASERARQDRRFPSALVTTPESLSLMLSRANARDELAAVTHVVVDEWHELIGSKRGVQVQLAIARLRAFNPSLVVWGLSATLGDLDTAMQTLCGDAALTGKPPRLVRGHIDKSLQIDTLIPDNPGRYTWAGHLGARMCDAVVREIEQSGISCCCRPGPNGPDRSRCITAASTRRCANGWSSASSRARCARWWPPRRLISGSISCRWSACCRSVRPRESRGCCSAPGAAAMRRGAAAASRWCRPTRSSSLRRQPRAGRCRQDGWSRAPAPTSRWTFWCSIWSRWRWAAVSSPMQCMPR